LILHPFSSSCSSFNPTNPGSDFCWIPACAGMTRKGVVRGTTVIPDKADEGGRDPESRIMGETPMPRAVRNPQLERWHEGWHGRLARGRGCLNRDSLDSRITLILHPFSSSRLSFNPTNPGSDFCWIPACAGMTAKGVVQDTTVIPDKGDRRPRSGNQRGGTGVSLTTRHALPNCSDQGDCTHSTKNSPDDLRCYIGF